MQYWLIRELSNDVVGVGRCINDDYFVLSANTNGKWVGAPSLWIELQTDSGYDLVDEATALAEVERIRSQAQEALPASA